MIDMMSELQSDYMKSNAIENVVYNKLSKKEYSELLNSKSDRALIGLSSPEFKRVGEQTVVSSMNLEQNVGY